jgi:8-oxo-dGTP pyrophosphatase MutT (NUDIX family)
VTDRAPGGEAVRPVDAATVILARQPEDAPWECFMVRRHVLSDFAADVFVFPGGKVDESDRDPAIADFVRDRADLQVDGDPVASLGVKLAAIRELFEEAGVLLAERDGMDLVRLDGEDKERYAEYRRMLHTGDLSMLELAQRERLCLAAHRLHPFSRWITPVNSPRRYDTRFFVTQMPEGQEPLHDALETTDSTWIAPGDALERFHRGDFPLVYATEKHLERMARYASIDQIIAATTPVDLEPVLPQIVQRGSETIFLMAGDEGYPER